MRLPAAIAVPICAGLIGAPLAQAVPWLVAGAPMRGTVLPAADEKPEPATSERARVAPGPSERNEPAAAEVRQTPAGGQRAGGAEDKPDAEGQDKRHD